MKEEQLTRKTSPRTLDDKALENVTGGLEKATYNGSCPYCKSINVSKSVCRYYCNDCKNYFD